MRDTLLPVPFISQYQDVLTKEHRQRACGMCCVAMALQYFDTPNLPSIDTLVETGMHSPDGYGPSGWKHDYFVSLFQSFGYECARKEHMTAADVSLIQAAIHAKNPVIASCVYRLFDRRHFHMVLITGVRENPDGSIAGLFYNDPMSLRGEGMYVPLPDFLTDWRGMAIFPKKTA